MTDHSHYDFRHSTPEERIEFLQQLRNLTTEEVAELRNNFSLTHESGNRLVENYISSIEVPMGIATNFLINGKEYLIPMAIEEPSVIAACSHGAKITRSCGGFKAHASESMMIGQIQLVEFEDRNTAEKAILSNERQIVDMANEKSNTLRSMGKGAKSLKINEEVSQDDMIIIHLLVDVGDAMGANLINSMCEYVAPFVEQITGGTVVLKILSNLSPDRVTTASAEFPSSMIGGDGRCEEISICCQAGQYRPISCCHT
jgi:Hydroxymethylglutaryl-CoA reductase